MPNISNMSEKLKAFEEAIMQQANKQCDSIQKQLDDYKNNELGRFEDEVLEDAYHLIQGEVSEISANSTTTLSQKNIDYKKKLFSIRDGYSGKIFDAAKEKLLSYTKTPAYENDLLAIIASFKTFDLGAGVEILVKKDDLSFADKIKKAYGSDCNVVAVNNIEIGGAMLQNPTNGFILDETLDTKLFDQHDWFHNNSGFTVEL